MKKLTDKQQIVLDFIREQVSRNDHFPTIRVMCLYFEWWSNATASHYLQTLCTKGYLVRYRTEAKWMQSNVRYRLAEVKP